MNKWWAEAVRAVEAYLRALGFDAEDESEVSATSLAVATVDVSGLPERVTQLETLLRAVLEDVDLPGAIAERVRIVLRAECGDPEPHGWQPCARPAGHDGLHSLSPQSGGYDSP